MLLDLVSCKGILLLIRWHHEVIKTSADSSSHVHAHHGIVRGSCIELIVLLLGHHVLHHHLLLRSQHSVPAEVLLLVCHKHSTLASNSCSSHHEILHHHLVIVDLTLGLTCHEAGEVGHEFRLLRLVRGSEIERIVLGFGRACLRLRRHG